jgi:hypothetical protein
MVGLMNEFPEMEYKPINGMDDGEELRVPPDIEPREFFLLVMRDHRQPMSRRMRAAEAAAPYIHPKLSATAILSGDDFANRLEKAIGRSGRVKEVRQLANSENGHATQADWIELDGDEAS